MLFVAVPVLAVLALAAVVFMVFNGLDDGGAAAQAMSVSSPGGRSGVAETQTSLTSSPSPPRSASVSGTAPPASATSPARGGIWAA